MDNSRYEIFVGKVLDGRYKILELVGVGGMAFVLKAEDMVMNRIVAIKILNEEFNGDEQAEQRFINESKAVAMLSHKNIVNIYDVAIYPDMKYIVMEYLDGITLKEYLNYKGRLQWKEACYYICQILLALEHAHSKGVIHRDIKPQNIILLKNGEIKVTDFGIAKLPTGAPLTMTDKAIGTVYYISPEQAGGKTTDFYSDLYSVGVMLYECVTGSLPFVATSPITVAMMQINDAPRDPSEIEQKLPKGLVQIILKAMEKAPEDRFRSAHGMLRAMEQIVGDPEMIFDFAAIVEPEPEIEETATSSLTIEKPSEIVYVPETVIDETEETKQSSETPTPIPIRRRPPRRRRRRRKEKGGGLLSVIAGVTFAFVVVALVSGGILAYKVIKHIGSQPKDDYLEITVPELIGEVFDEEFEKELLEQKIRVLKITYTYNAEFADGEIISQSPLPDAIRKISREGEYVDVTLSVSLGKGSVVLPDLKYYDKREAESFLKKYNINVQKLYTQHDTILDGYVVSTSPEAGQVVNAGDIVYVYISQGQEVEMVKVPLLMGLTLEKAEIELDKVKLSLGEVKYEVTNELLDDGKIIFQAVSEGQKVAAYSTEINVTVAKYEEPVVSEPEISDESIADESVGDESLGDESVGDESVGDVPSVDESTDTPPADESTDIPPAEESTDTPPADESTDAPPAEESTDTPPAEESTDTPPAEESTDTPPAEESTETPPAEESEEVPNPWG